MMQTVVRFNSKGWLAFVLAALMFALSALPVSAAESGDKVEIRVKVGISQMKVDGETIKLQQPPFKSAGNVMVPLSVFTNAKGFGAKVQLKNNKIITLAYLKHVIVLTLGSKSAMIDGKKATLAVAPVNKKGVTMVPLTILAKSFGATQATDAATKEIVIQAVSASSGSGNSGSGIDSDSGKSQIGDSYYKWSMNYPTGLVQQKQWSDGDWITFSDVKGDYYLALSIDEAEEPLDIEDKRELLRDNLGEETVVDVKSVTRPSGAFERMITKDSDGFYYEYRGIQANGYFYTLTFGKKAKSASELDANAGLLDSFRTTFNAGNKSLKDLARIKDGKIVYENEDYGLKIQLPKEWSQDTEESSPYFYGPDESYLLLNVYSLNQDDTLDKWVERKRQLFKAIIAEAYRKEPETSSITWNGVPATLVKIAYSTDGKKWWNEVEIYAVKGNYKYYVDYTFEQEHKDEVEDVVKQLLEGMTVDFTKVEKSFGQVPDPEDNLDLNATATKTSKKYGYSLTVPKMWAKGISDMEEDSVEFSEFGTNLLVAVQEDTSLEGYPELLEKTYTNSGVLNLDAKTKVTFAGRDAFKFELSTTKLAEYASHMTIYLFENEGDIYMVQGMQYDAYASELNRKRLEDAIKSFHFTK